MRKKRICRICGNLFTIHYYKDKSGRLHSRNRCNDCEKERKHKWVLKIKTQVMSYYGGKCSCCGEDQLEFLTIDHVNKPGNIHRKEIGISGGGGLRFYRWLQKNNYPLGYRVLCFNCNCAIGHYGYCPHHKDIYQIYNQVSQIEKSIEKLKYIFN